MHQFAPSTLHHLSYWSISWRSLFSSFFPSDEITSVCHLLPYIPETERQAFLDDLFVIIDNKYITAQIDEDEEGENKNVRQYREVTLYYDYLTIVAAKK